MSEDTLTQREINRMLSAAVVNKRFEKLLLTNPGLAIASGYAGETFNFNEKAQMRISSIHADSLQDFARQLIQVQEPAFASVVCLRK
jgi:hypothetical protein